MTEHSKLWRWIPDSDDDGVVRLVSDDDGEENGAWVEVDVKPGSVLANANIRPGVEFNDGFGGIFRSEPPDDLTRR